MSPELLRLAIALAEGDRREEGARALAGALGATDLHAFVADAELGGRMVLAPGFAAIPGGRGWRALLDACRRPGVHRGEVESAVASGAPQQAIAHATGRGAFVLTGRPRAEAVTALAEGWPLIEAALIAEHASFCAAGQLRVAQIEAQRASTLAEALDRARGELARSIEKLEQQARALEEARARAESATRAKDQFLAMLGHELRNPLAPIVTALHLLRMKDVAMRELETIERQVQHLMRLVDDLLDIGRVVNGKLELRFAVVSAAAFVDRAAEMASPLLERKRQRLEVVYEHHGLATFGDETRLAQVVSNLLTNASRYSDEGRPITIRVARHDARRIAIHVEDQGVGMAPEVLERAFDAFFQAPQRLDRARGGLGLGLAIVQAIVRQHGGEVRAASEGEGRGSRFTVILPIASEDDARASPHPPAHVPGHAALPGGLRVLIVDDNEELTTSLASALELRGCRVGTALDGPQALLEADRLRPSVALLDLGLPVMDGYELAQRLRERPWARALKLVAISGYAQPGDRERALAAGFDQHLSKPVPVEELTDAIAELIGTA